MKSKQIVTIDFSQRGLAVVLLEKRQRYVEIKGCKYQTFQSIETLQDWFCKLPNDLIPAGVPLILVLNHPHLSYRFEDVGVPADQITRELLAEKMSPGTQSEYLLVAEGEGNTRVLLIDLSERALSNFVAFIQKREITLQTVMPPLLALNRLVVAEDSASEYVIIDVQNRFVDIGIFSQQKLVAVERILQEDSTYDLAAKIRSCTGVDPLDKNIYWAGDCEKRDFLGLAEHMGAYNLKMIPFPDALYLDELSSNAAQFSANYQRYASALGAALAATF